MATIVYTSLQRIFDFCSNMNFGDEEIDFCPDQEVDDQIINSLETRIKEARKDSEKQGKVILCRYSDEGIKLIKAQCN